MKTNNRWIKLFFTIATVSAVYFILLYPYTYPQHRALANGDTVMGADGNHNQDKLLMFYQNYLVKGSDHIRITNYSKEGFPEIIDIKLVEGNLECRIDNTKNLYGRDWFIEKQNFASIKINSQNDYFLIDQSGKEKWIFQMKVFK